ncbi:MAG TPA: bifunctional YncE family protein/alkaline phosphatase family protein [Pirellulales bacterium]|nr:bifunctional YncE family protein/alkaline phosphatase family protein [Pirellulales bacterium]
MRNPNRVTIVGLSCLLCLAVSKLAAAADDFSPPRWPGLQSDGRTLLPNQWTLQPAGKQIPLGDFPVHIALHPSQPWAAVLHCGYSEHEVVIVDLKNQQIASREKLPQSFYGLTFDPAGKRLFASGGEFEVVHEFAFAEGQLSDHKELRISDVKSKGVPTGLACSHDAKTLFVANAWGNRISFVPLAEPAKIENLELPKRSYPYAVLPTRDGHRLYASLWGQGSVAVIDPAAKTVMATWPVGIAGINGADSHPTEMALSPDEKLLYVACSNGNSTVVVETATGRSLEQITSALYPQALNGSTPNSLALSSDGKVLLVANADNNNLAMIDVSRPGKSRSLGFIPVGWYPTSVRFTAGDKQILVANGKGIEPRANPDGPRPGTRKTKTTQYIGSLLQGTLSVIEAPSPADMARYSQQARGASPLRENESAPIRPAEANNAIPAKVGDPSPIKHCIYIIKENRTYDQVFGDMKEGNGDPNLVIFGEKVTPNLHALAREFVLLDNLYCDAEVSADGHEWSMAAYATDFVEKTWPLNYRGHALGKIAYPSEGGHPIAYPAAGYIWDRCKESGVSYRSYGEFVDNGPKPGDPAHTEMKTLEGHFDPQFHGWDLDYPDAKRTDRFLEELRGFEKSGAMPQFIVMRLGNDHTHGTALGKPTPTAMVAENDLALGRLIEGISHSKLWPEIAVFVIEDDAQNGSDHVDAHRTEAFVISPYTKRHAVDSTLYSTTSMLRTMELILGLKPLSQFDAAATPMYNAFQSRANTAPYQHRGAGVDLAAMNGLLAWGVKDSARMDFSREDAADDNLLNEVIWHSVRGADSPMPPPVHAAFVRASAAPRPDGDDD